MFETLLIQPLYNGFVYLINVIPGGDVGFAIIVLTFLVRFLFYPVFASQIKTTMGMQAMQADLEVVKEKYKNNREEQSRQLLGLYKKHNVNPFALILSLIIQIPIFIALYFTFIHTTLPAIDTDLLYSFVQVPTTINVQFLNFIDLTKSGDIILTLCVAGLQYLVVRYSMGRTNKSTPKNLSPEKLAVFKMQQNMMMYVLPGVIAAISFTLPSAVGLYFAAGSVAALAQEWLVRRHVTPKNEAA